jgi:hypothetical protein
VAIDKVRPLKLEDPASGGDETDLFPTSLDPSEDNVMCNGIVLEDATHSDENVRVWRDGNDLKFKDTNNPTDNTLTDLLAGGGGTSHAAYFDVTLSPPSSEAFGTVSGLPHAPVKVAGFAIREQDVMVQSGLFYDAQVVNYNADGFDYRIAIDLDEWWPGPGPVTLRVQYVWSES